MFERFTERARRVLVLAQEEARMLSQDHVGTEHILLGLVHVGNGIAARALQSLGVTEDAVRQQVGELTGRAQRATEYGHLPFTPQAKKVLQLSLREALALGHNYIGTEHILLGVLREGGDVAAQVLMRLGVDSHQARHQVIELLDGPQASGDSASGRAKRLVGGLTGRGERRLLAELLSRLGSIESRLSALEHRVGTGPGTPDLDQEIRQVRGDKEAAIDAQDFETAAVLRDRERALIDEKDARQEEWAAAHQDLPSLTDEVERLRSLLRQHGIEPRDGAA
jgi:ATP-dependent Clp protease ATP-binding subunit ClpA